MVHSDAKKVRAYFFANINGQQPVRDWLLSLDVQDRRTIGEDIKAVEYGWPRGYHPPSLIKRLDGKISEVRSDISAQRTARVLFAVIGREMVLAAWLHQKNQKDPEIRLGIGEKSVEGLQPGTNTGTNRWRSVNT